VRDCSEQEARVKGRGKGKMDEERAGIYRPARATSPQAPLVSRAHGVFLPRCLFRGLLFLFALSTAHFTRGDQRFNRRVRAYSFVRGVYIYSRIPVSHARRTADAEASLRNGRPDARAFSVAVFGAPVGEQDPT
jgi:hypothetical protein